MLNEKDKKNIRKGILRTKLERRTTQGKGKIPEFADFLKRRS